jgi:hypothetical protein
LISFATWKEGNGNGRRGTSHCFQST